MSVNFVPGHRVQSFDGLRGFAVCLVIAHHTGIQDKFAVGPEIFFVLSGYLVTRSLEAKHSKDARSILLEFHRRRILRLLPPLLFLLAVAVLVFSCAPALDPSLPRTVLAALTSSLNWQLALTPWRSLTLVHLWSLAAEQQFYLLWPAAFLLLPRSWARPFLVSALVGTVSWRCALYLGGASVERLYFALDTHADGLIVGCLLALMPPPAGWHRWLRFAGPVALVGVLAVAFVVSVTFPFAPVVCTSVVTVLAALLVSAAAVDGPLARLMTRRPIRMLGLLSYSLYLWHLPILVLFDPHWAHGRTVVRLAAVLACSLTAYLLVERPTARHLRRTRREPLPRRGAERRGDPVPSGDLLPQRACEAAAA